MDQGNHAIAEVTVSQPHVAFTHGLSSRWTYLQRTILDIRDLLLPLENAIHQQLITALTGRPSCFSVERDLLALPDGLGLSNTSTSSSDVFHASQSLTAPLVALLVAQDVSQIVDPEATSTIKKNIRKSASDTINYS